MTLAVTRVAATVLGVAIVTGIAAAGEAARPEALAKRLKGAGAVPLSLDGNYVVPFEFTVAGDDAGSTISVGGGAGQARDWSGAPHVRALSFSAQGTVSGPTVFAGYGMVVPDGRHDSYSGVDVKDKIVIVLDGRPGDVSADDRVEFERCSHPRYKAMQALVRGAKAIVFVERTAPISRAGRLAPSASPPGAGIVAVSVGSEVSEAIFGGISQGNLDEIRARVDGGDPHVTGFEIPGLELTVASRVESRPRKGFNVVGGMPAGGDASGQATGFVVLGARADIVAKGGGPAVDLVIEVGRRLAETPVSHGVVLALWSGDTSAPFASTAFIESGLIKTESILGYINVDALGPLSDDRLFVESVASSPVWPGLVERVNIVAGFDVEMRDDPFVPADSTAFYLADVPTVNLFSGHDSGEGRAAVLEKEELDRLSGFVEGLIRKLATQDRRPEFVALERGRRNSGADGPPKPFTGTVPDYAADVKGLRLDGVIEGGPAAKAGLREGDIIIEFGGKTIADVYGYMDALAEVKIDQPVRVVFIRDGVSMETVVTPTKRR